MRFTRTFVHKFLLKFADEFTAYKAAAQQNITKACSVPFQCKH
jgi:hypothetical protein